MPEQNPDVDFEPGDDEGEYDDDLPAAQVHQEDEPDPFAEAEESNEDLQEQIDEIIEGVGAVDMSSNKHIVLETFHCAGVKLKGAETDDVANVMGVVAFLGAGTVLNSLDIELGDNQQDVSVNGYCAPQMALASSIIPYREFFAHNPVIVEPLK